MGNWQTVLALLALAWALQCVGTFIQIRRYRAAFGELSSARSDGWMGVGKGGGGAFRAGAIVMVVVAPDDTVCRAVAIRGRTVFAKAVRLEAFEGRTVAELRREAAGRPREAIAAGLIAALDQTALVRAAKLASAVAPPALEPVPA